MAVYYGNELYHHGILGQKWGVRRYQNEDGSLTEEGRLRYKVDTNGNIKKLSRAERKAVKAAKKEQDEIEAEKNKPLKQKNISRMSDEELQQYIARMRQEKDAYTLKRDVNNLSPAKKTSGEKLLDFASEKILPELVNVGKDYLKDYLKQISKPEESEEEKAMAAKKKERDSINLEKDIWTAKAAIAKSKESVENIANKKNKDKTFDNSTKTKVESNENQSSAKGVKAEKWEKQTKNDDNSWSFTPGKDSDIIDADYVVKNMKDNPSTKSGESYVSEMALTNLPVTYLDYKQKEN